MAAESASPHHQAAFASYLLDDIERALAALQGIVWVTPAQADAVRAQLAPARKRIEAGTQPQPAPAATEARPAVAKRPSGVAVLPMPAQPRTVTTTNAAAAAQPALPSRPQPAAAAAAAAAPPQLVVVPTHDLEPAQPGDLRLVKGERIVVTDSATDPNWWVGTAPNGDTGSFPCTFVQIVQGTSGTRTAQPSQQAPPAYAAAAGAPTTVHHQTVIVQQAPPQQPVQVINQGPPPSVGRQLGGIAASSAAVGFGVTAGSLVARSIF